MKDKCLGIGGFLFGHSFEPIFEDMTEYQKMEEGLAKDILCATQTHPPLLKKGQKYIKTVCKRCGKELGKQNE